ncbi:MAG TPA: class I SAM-dependent methyltransferase [Pseudonocardiaceae bacterium]|jgi:SAM-dependent methyltransferase|nr:class I SAM-dependent methyltransferase [Pseudonocardiaceae bacterium]
MTDGDLIAAQRGHWQRTYRAHPEMYGLDASDPAQHAIKLCQDEELRHVLELGAGQGRDTLAFLRAGRTVTALDFAPDGVAAIRDQATAAGLHARLDARVHDAREPLPLPDSSVDAVYSHMLLCMAFTTTELDGIASEIRRVLRPGGWHVYTVRHTGDAHYRAGTPHGDNRWENGGFVVHFFDRALVDRLAAGLRLTEIAEFEEGELPRRLWRITLRKPEG